MSPQPFPELQKKSENRRVFLGERPRVCGESLHAGFVGRYVTPIAASTDRTRVRAHRGRSPTCRSALVVGSRAHAVGEASAICGRTHPEGAPPTARWLDGRAPAIPSAVARRSIRE
jgi:hypothetical protein